jgi:hypothetical protein
MESEILKQHLLRFHQSKKWLLEESNPIKAAEPVEILPPPRTLDDVFKYFYNKGSKSLPKGIQINAEKWKGNII